MTIGEMRLGNNMTSEIEETGTKIIAALVAIVATVVIGLLTLWYIFYNSREVSAIQTLATRCEANGGVMIEGVNDDGSNVNHFSVCVPFEVLTCADIE